MTDRYKTMFANRARLREGAFIPFVVLGDPDHETSIKIIQDIIDAGADALELGLPFSDPVADGPIIQKSSERALKAGIKTKGCFEIISHIRQDNNEIPIGILVYANLVITNGLDAFFTKAKKAGIDSVLIADVPMLESIPFQKAAKKHGVKLVLILPIDSDPQTITNVASGSAGYLYLLSRKGVTGTGSEAGMPSASLMKTLQGIKSSPPVLGFGVSKPEHVQAAIQAGCKGVIVGSAVVEIISQIIGGLKTSTHLKKYISIMKTATRIES